MTSFPVTLRAAKGPLGVHKAAKLVGCAPSTFHRWLAGTCAPHEAVQADVIKKLNEQPK